MNRRRSLVRAPLGRPRGPVRSTRLALALLVAATGLVAARAAARADCAGPNIATSPPSGAAVPPDPTIHIFFPALSGDKPIAERIQVTADGVPVSARVEQVSRNEAFTTARIAVDTDGQRAITVAYDSGWERSEVIYTVDPDWRRPARRPAALSRVERRQDAWTCSFTDAWFLEMATPADAYRVEWASSPSAWTRGAQATQVFPRSDMDFWHQSDESPGSRRGPGSIGLGHLNCFAYTIPAEALAAPIYIKITALFADGSESPAWSAPRRIGDAAAPVPPESVAPALVPMTTLVEPPIPPEPRSAASPALTTAFAVTGLTAVALAGLALVLLIVRRARQRRLARTASPPR